MVARHDFAELAARGRVEKLERAGAAADRDVLGARAVEGLVDGSFEHEPERLEALRNLGALETLLECRHVTFGEFAFLERELERGVKVALDRGEPSPERIAQVPLEGRGIHAVHGVAAHAEREVGHPLGETAEPVVEDLEVLLVLRDEHGLFLVAAADEAVDGVEGLEERALHVGRGRARRRESREDGEAGLRAKGPNSFHRSPSPLPGRCNARAARAAVETRAYGLLFGRSVEKLNRRRKARRGACDFLRPRA